MNDAELDAFLNGKDELSRRLQALEQPSPSAELDAAILARTQRPEAANDASDGVDVKAPMQHLGLRWRVPAGIAATVLAGVLAHQAWQGAADLDRTGEVRRAVTPVPMQPAPEQPVAIEPAPAPQSKPAPPKHTQAPARHSAPKSSEPPAVSYTLQAPAVPPPAEALYYSQRATPVFAPPSAPAVAAAPEAPRTIEVNGRRNRSEVYGAVAARTAQPDPKAWLSAIDEMIKAGLQRDALEEWDKFRAAWPDYPVPAETLEKINALRK